LSDIRTFDVFGFGDLNDSDDLIISIEAMIRKEPLRRMIIGSVMNRREGER